MRKKLEVKLSNDQQKALDTMLAGKNVFLSGEAGTGKSFVIRHFISLAQNYGKNVMVCAPTGIAAINIKGSTLHRTFSVPIEPISPHRSLPKLSDTVKKADIIIIDEISMCRFDVFDFVCRYIRATESSSDESKQKQLIVIGDFFQLPPVITDKDRKVLENYWGTDKVGAGYAFLSPEWAKCNFKSVVLHEVLRQKDDFEFVTNLNAVRKGQQDSLKWFNENTSKIQTNGIYLCSTNDAARERNNAAISKLRNRKKIFTAIITGKVTAADMACERDLEICSGARVMSLVNDLEDKYQNGTLGTVVRLNRLTDGVVVKFDNGHECEIVRHNWEVIDYEVVEDKTTKKKKLEKTVIGTISQIPLKIAYAITIHKSQGQTYDAANINPACFCEGQLYVALSRVTRADGIYLTSKIQDKFLVTSQDVIDFYDRIESENDSDLNSLQNQKSEKKSVKRVKKSEAQTSTETKTKKVELEPKQEVEAKTLILSQDQSKKNRGGKREGAGRRGKFKNLETKTIRVPIEAIPAIQKLLDDMYK